MEGNAKWWARNGWWAFIAGLSGYVLIVGSIVMKDIFKGLVCALIPLVVVVAIGLTGFT